MQNLYNPDVVEKLLTTTLDRVCMSHSGMTEKQFTRTLDSVQESRDPDMIYRETFNNSAGWSASLG